MQTINLRWLSLVMLAVLVVGTACSGEPRPETEAGATPGSGDVVADSDVGGGKSSKKGTKGGFGKGSGKSKSKKSNSGSGSGGGGAGAAPSAPTTSVSAGGGSVSTKEQARRSENLERGLPKVNLWPRSTNRMGITKDKIVLCGHAALTFADIFDTRPEDIRVYWEWVNDNGGIYGRKVDITFEDDGYRPDRAVEAAERCKAKKAFMLLGGIGFDQIPAVRAWNEQSQNRLLYLHHIARADYSKRYSFSYLPTVEQMGSYAAKWILAKHRNDKIGVLWRQSESWQPGHKAFLSRLRQGGKRPVADLPVQKDQAVYTQQISELKARGAKTVFVWENALAATELVKQAKQQDYSPTWIVFPFQLTTDALGRDSLTPPMEGIASWLAYVPGRSSGPWGSYGAEIRRFEAAQRKYGRAQKGNDILWMTWIAMKQLHQLLLDCGPDCGRNEAVALLISGRHKAVFPNCPFDFTRNQHVGGFTANTFRAVNVQGYGAGWAPAANCVRI